MHSLHFSGDSPVAQMVKNANAGDLGLIPESGRFPENGNGNPLQHSCLGIPWTEEPVGTIRGGHKRVGLSNETTLQIPCSHSHVKF